MLSNCGAGEDSSESLGLQKRSYQSILNEINPEYLLGGLMLKLKLQYFGHLLGRADSLEKTTMLGKIESRRRRANRGWDGWMASLTQWTWVQASFRSWWWTRKPGVLPSMGLQSRTQLSDWTGLTDRKQINGCLGLKVEGEWTTEKHKEFFAVMKIFPSLLR